MADSTALSPVSRDHTAVDTASRSTALRKIAEKGDLSGLNWDERWHYMLDVCKSAGLDPMTRPFDFIDDRGKVSLYINKTGTAQLRDKENVSIVDVKTEQIGDQYIVYVHACLPTGRRDVDVGAVAISNDRGKLTGLMLSNAIKKAITQGKRRVTLSICGLGFLDASETDDIAGARTLQATDVERRLFPMLEASDAARAAEPGVGIPDSSSAASPSPSHSLPFGPDSVVDAVITESPTVVPRQMRDGTVVDTRTGVVLEDAPAVPDDDASNKALGVAVNNLADHQGVDIKKALTVAAKESGVTERDTKRWSEDDRRAVIDWIAVKVQEPSPVAGLEY